LLPVFSSARGGILSVFQVRKKATSIFSIHVFYLSAMETNNTSEC
jgi:hypothetical protein